MRTLKEEWIEFADGPEAAKLVDELLTKTQEVFDYAAQAQNSVNNAVIEDDGSGTGLCVGRLFDLQIQSSKTFLAFGGDGGLTHEFSIEPHGNGLRICVPIPMESPDEIPGCEHGCNVISYYDGEGRHIESKMEIVNFTSAPKFNLESATFTFARKRNGLAYYHVTAVYQGEETDIEDDDGGPLVSVPLQMSVATIAQDLREGIEGLLMAVKPEGVGGLN